MAAVSRQVTLRIGGRRGDGSPAVHVGVPKAVRSVSAGVVVLSALRDCDIRVTLLKNSPGEVIGYLGKPRHASVMRGSDTVMTTLLFMMMALSCVTCLVLCIAEFVLHRPLPVQIPSVYWLIAKLGFFPNRKVRGAFRFLFCDLYRKRFWNPVVNTWRNKRALIGNDIFPPTTFMRHVPR